HANDVMAYIPSLRVLQEGGYEGDTSMVPYGQPAKWAPPIEELIVGKVHELVSAVQTADVRSPLSPQEALEHFHLDPGLRIELVAAEPVIESPVAMAFDEDGRLWVVEMRDYPNGPPPGQPPQGRIKVL